MHPPAPRLLRELIAGSMLHRQPGTGMQYVRQAIVDTLPTKELQERV